MKTDREIYGFIGPVHSVRTEIESLPSKTYRISAEGRELLEVFTHDHAGQEHQVVLFPFDELFIFDKDGRLLEEASSERSLINQEPFRYVYTYDEAGRVIQRDEYDQDGSEAGKTLYTYDPEGRKVEETRYTVKGYGRHYAKFDEKGNIVESAWYGPDGVVRMRDTWDYCYTVSENQMEEVSSYKSEMPGAPPDLTAYAPLSIPVEQLEQYIIEPQQPQQRRRVTVYDETGCVIEKVEYDTDGSIFSRETYNARDVTERHFLKDKEVFIYNDQEQLVEIIQTGPSDEFRPEPLNRRYVFRYDPKGNEIEEIVYNADGSLDSRETYEYEYDDYGNWTKKVKTSLSNKWRTEPERIAFESVTIYYRSITYY